MTNKEKIETTMYLNFVLLDLSRMVFNITNNDLSHFERDLKNIEQRIELVKYMVKNS